MTDDARHNAEVCHWCGGVINTEPVLWDIPEERTDGVYWRYGFCNDDCLDAAKHADHRYAETHTEGERLRKKDMSEVHK